MRETCLNLIVFSFLIILLASDAVASIQEGVSEMVLDSKVSTFRLVLLDSSY